MNRLMFTIAADALVLHVEILATVNHEAVELFESVGVEQQIDALARGQLAGVVLTLDASLAAALARFVLAALELFEPVVVCHLAFHLERGPLHPQAHYAFTTCR